MCVCVCVCVCDSVCETDLGSGWHCAAQPSVMLSPKNNARLLRKRGGTVTALAFNATPSTSSAEPVSAGSSQRLICSEL